MTSLDIKENRKGVTFCVRVQPRASKNEIKGLYGKAMRVRLTSPPVEGAANKECISFFAKRLKVAKGRVAIVSGEASRDKIISVEGVKKSDVLALLGGD
ncbi:MAG TPA: DUF167 domain-containing protein [Clostridia bacterium]|nr:DUF167 domain-containing protein [Clostridia bacterium]